MRCAAIASFSCVAALAWSTTASATPTARLVYGRGPGAESCPDETVLRKEVSARIGYDPFFPYAARSVVLTMNGDTTKLTARIELVENGQATARELTTGSGSCIELAESAALAIAIAIDPRALIAPAPPTPDAAPEAPLPPPSLEAPPVQPVVESPRTTERPQPAASRKQRPWTRVMIGPRVGAALQPGVAAGLGVGSALVWKLLSIGVELESYLPSRVTASSGATVRGWLVDGALVPCFRRLPIILCGVARAGRFEGAGENVIDPTTEATVFLGLGGRGEVELEISDAVSAHIGGDLLGNLTRPRLKVGPETVWEAPQIAGVLAVSTSYRF